MAEKIRPQHLPAASAPSQQPLLPPFIQADGSHHGMSKAQQMQVLHSHSPSQPDIALHARPASSSVTGTPHLHLQYSLIPVLEEVFRKYNTL